MASTRAPGLSPRARGNLERLVAPVRVDGTIPACAGEPPAGPATRPTCWDYPRVRGGTYSVRPSTSNVPGLSPRARGNRRVAVCAGDGAGTIPACAGEPPAPCWPTGRSGDYPRVRGGTASCAACPWSPYGLSPRARGNLIDQLADDRVAGTIPACAGEPSRTSPAVSRSADYPRVRGGTVHDFYRVDLTEGLSPRARGNRRGREDRRRGSGTIPACAGEPSTSWAGSSRSRDYPRVRGGTTYGELKQIAALGLSPRARGNRERDAD